ncbi:MAG TPA: hypothetical protein VHG08_26755 [Longimicrobium sp.]|nr:hypothetical protein [Longimicrobium sp.]
MSPVTIHESGLAFGPFDEDKCFPVEQSALYASLGEGVKMVEFILLRPGKGGVSNLFCVEAKTSAPQQGSQPRFDEYFAEVREKMLNALLLFLGARLGRDGDAADELPEGLRTPDLRAIGFKFVLVVSTAEESWLVPLQDKFTQVMRSAVKSFNVRPASTVVLDTERARKQGLIT